jgi:hypothetical protein
LFLVLFFTSLNFTDQSNQMALAAFIAYNIMTEHQLSGDDDDWTEAALQSLDEQTREYVAIV